MIIRKMEHKKITLYKCIILFIVLILPNALASSEGILGDRQKCSNEGEEAKIDLRYTNCYKCICQNGFVECQQKETCPAVDDCYIYNKKTAGGCCDKCKECSYNGKIIASGTEWSDPDNPCSHFKCVSGVVTESNLTCYTPCKNPLPTKDGQCCASCQGCHFNGQIVPEGQEATLNEDPCVKCRCSGKKLTCVKKACPVLQCPASKQSRIPGECCPRCNERREAFNPPKVCIMGKALHNDGKEFIAEQCSKCTCINGTSICRKDSCPVLECPQEYQKRSIHECCPYCERDFTQSCTINGHVYRDAEVWSLDSCRTCQCLDGTAKCAFKQCPKAVCKPNEILKKDDNECCEKCVESPAVCTVFGDPHYKTFDGKFFSFQGSCKYQLAADCHKHTFSIRVTNDGRNKKFSSWTKTVTLKMGAIKVTLGQKKRVKVNGTKIDLPYRIEKIIYIHRNSEDEIVVRTELGIVLTWDGKNYIQVQVPTKYKNKLCGLCGNYNSVSRDDITARNGTSMNEREVWNFAKSWAVGGEKACTRSKKAENRAAKKHPCARKPHACKALKEYIFKNCNSVLNPDNYFDACKSDMCECTTQNCYCDSFAAYAHECERLGVKLPHWRKETGCSRNRSHSGNLKSRPHPIFDLYKPTRKRLKQKRPKALPAFLTDIPPPSVQYVPSRTPPPIH